jgi:hypothetical protein
MQVGTGGKYILHLVANKLQNFGGQVKSAESIMKTILWDIKNS